MVQWWSSRLPPLCPGFNSQTLHHMGLSSLVLYSASRNFSPGTPVFPSPQKPTLSNSNSILECTGISDKFLSCSWCSMSQKNYNLHLYIHFYIYRSKQSASFDEQIMSKGKYESIFLGQIEAIVLIILRIFFAT